MTKTFLLSAMLAVLFAAPAFAQCNPSTSDTPCIGQLCEAKGTTVMDRGGQDIIACLPRGDLPAGAQDTRPLFWKAASVDSDLSCPAGQVLQRIVNGKPDCVNNKTSQGFLVAIKDLTYYHPGCYEGNSHIEGPSDAQWAVLNAMMAQKYEANKTNKDMYLGDSDSVGRFTWTAHCISACARFCRVKGFTGGNITEENASSVQCDCF